MKIILHRILAFIIDMSIGAFIGVILDLLFRFCNIDSDAPFYLSLSYILIKDIFTLNGSFGKKLLKLQLSGVNIEITIFRKVLRNLTTFLWPLELIILLIFKRRIGDMLFKTEVKYLAPAGL